MALTNNELLNEMQQMIDEGASGSSVIERFAGETIYFPQKGLNKDERNRAICNERKSGVSVTDLMQKYHLSNSQIYKIIESGWFDS